MWLLRAADRVIFEQYATSRDNLVAYRFLIAAFLLTSLLPRYDWIGQFPDAFFDPPIGTTYFFWTGFPPRWVFQILDAALVVAATFLLCGRRVTTVSWLLTGGLLIGNAWAFSFGKINHEMQLVIAPALMACAGWDRRTTVRAWPVALFALCIALAMFTAAWQKAISGWLDPDTQAVLGQTLANIGVWGRETVLSSIALSWTSRLVWEAQDVATIVLEFAFLAAWPRQKAFRIVCACACLFHLGVALLMQIGFASSIVAYAAFVDWHAVATRVHLQHRWQRLQSWLEARSLAQVVTAGLSLALFYTSIGNPVALVVEQTHDNPTYPIALMLCFLAAGGACVFLWNQARRRVFDRSC